MTKQYIVVTTNPEAGHPEWRGESYTFNSLFGAENCKRGTIECLRRPDQRYDPRSGLAPQESADKAKSDAVLRMKGRQFAIVVIDVERMIGPVGSFWQRLKWAARYVVSDYRFRPVRLNERRTSQPGK